MTKLFPEGAPSSSHDSTWVACRCGHEVELHTKNGECDACECLQYEANPDASPQPGEDANMATQKQAETPPPQQEMAKESKSPKRNAWFDRLLAKPTKFIQEMAGAYGQDTGEYIAALRATALKPPKQKGSESLQPEFSYGEVQAFLTTAQQYGLDPLLKEIHCSRDKWGRLLVVVGVDGWVKIANSRPEMDGVEFDLELDDQRKPLACTCTIYRKDRSHPVRVTEYIVECDQKIGAWQSHPRRFLRHKALIQCVRYAFGVSGIMDEDEARRAERGELDVPEAPRVEPAKASLDAMTAELQGAAV